MEFYAQFTVLLSNFSA